MTGHVPDDVTWALAAGIAAVGGCSLVPAAVVVDVLLDVRGMTHHPGTVAVIDTELGWLSKRRTVTEAEAVTALSWIQRYHDDASQEQLWAW